jgi:hypothetical protein
VQLDEVVDHTANATVESGAGDRILEETRTPSGARGIDLPEPFEVGDRVYIKSNSKYGEVTAISSAGIYVQEEEEKLSFTYPEKALQNITKLATNKSGLKLSPEFDANMPRILEEITKLRKMDSSTCSKPKKMKTNRRSRMIIPAI